MCFWGGGKDIILLWRARAFLVTPRQPGEIFACRESLERDTHDGFLDMTNLGLGTPRGKRFVKIGQKVHQWVRNTARFLERIIAPFLTNKGQGV